MIRLGWRLAVAGDKEAQIRLGLIAVAVGMGIGLLLTTIASLNAFEAQDQRYAWLETGYSGALSEPASEAADPLWWALRADYYQGEPIWRVDVAATGPESPVPPGMDGLPAPGELYASPAVADLLGDTPGAVLGDRYRGEVVGTIGPRALPAPSSMIVVVGHAPSVLSRWNNASQVTQISTTPPGECSGECAPSLGTSGAGMTLVLGVVAVALLFPVLVFVGGSTRLSAARREQRFAAMRLVGATPRQVTRLAVVEASIASMAGTLLGFGVFYAIRPAIATIPFTGDPLFTRDFSLTTGSVLLVAIGVPIAAALAAVLSLRRVNITPLGVARRVTPRPPRLFRLAPLAAGIVWLGYLSFSKIADGLDSDVQTYAYLLGALVTMIGLVVAGPWLTLAASRLTARGARRATSLIAARRLADNPGSAFRAISGLVLAVYVGSCTIGIITTTVPPNDSTESDAISSSTVIHELARPHDDVTDEIARMSEETRTELSSIDGVTGISTIHFEPPIEVPPSYISCNDLIDTPALGRCPENTEVVSITPAFAGGVLEAPMVDSTWPVADVGPSVLSEMPVATIVVATDGSVEAVEQARTTLGQAHPGMFPPQTINEYQAENTRTSSNIRQLATVVLLASLVIAGCSLAVNTAGGLVERRRPFSLLRLTGVPLGMLRRIVVMETASPLLVGVLVSAGAGWATAALLLHGQLDLALQPPSATFYLVIVGGVFAALAIFALTLPLLSRLTGPEMARTE